MGGFFSGGIGNFIAPPDPISQKANEVVGSAENQLVKAKLLPEAVAKTNQSLLNAPNNIIDDKKKQLLGD